MIKFYSYKKKFFLFFILLIDFLIYPFAFLIEKANFFSTKNLSGKKMLIFNLGGLGDTVLLEPLIRFLHFKYSDLQIDVISTQLSSGICQLIPGVNNIFIFPDYKRGLNLIGWCKFLFKHKNSLLKKYFVGIDTHGNPLTIIFMLIIRVHYRSGFLNGGLGGLLHISQDSTKIISRSQQLLSLCTEENEDVRPFLNTRDSLLKPGQKLVNQFLLAKPFLGIHLGAGEYDKLFPLELWQELIGAFVAKYTVVNFGSLSDRNNLLSLSSELQMKIIDLSGKSIIDTVGAISRMSLFIGHDTGLTHIASALGVKTICLFSLSHNPIIWAPSNADVFTFDYKKPENLSPKTIINHINSL